MNDAQWALSIFAIVLAGGLLCELFRLYRSGRPR